MQVSTSAIMVLFPPACTLAPRMTQARWRHPGPIGCRFEPARCVPDFRRQNHRPGPQGFGGKRVYGRTLNMPNLNSTTGSWVIKFAELGGDRKEKEGELLEPVATEKSDPAIRWN